ncbi:MAG: hypothetical protein MRJ65_04505 [Candidatus Brocadiaceae bacterium]|nr:hypothetical protein [Candidatus Brocadiaceae bacterium]
MARKKRTDKDDDESSDGGDNNCDRQIDEGLKITFFFDWGLRTTLLSIRECLQMPTTVRLPMIMQ